MYISFPLDMIWQKENTISKLFGVACVIKLPDCGCTVCYVNVMFVGVFHFGCGGTNEPLV